MLATPKNMKEAADILPTADIVMYSPVTGDRYSGNPHDYWDTPDNYEFPDTEGNTMLLGYFVQEFVQIGANNAQ